MVCRRCGTDKKIENHHKKQRIHGGGNEPENLEELCQGCHDYEHARRYIQTSLDYERERGDGPRIAVYEHRLRVNEELNTPELIRERGFTSYWTDSTTHYLPRRNLTSKEATLEGQISLWVETGQTK